ncbi:unnamed protein product [Cyclocybe aegerita]|uniref:Uncharacterized protein n=1 Tax=Cyclocybe aegerita TaxID=1973307 RepID=A0A8S0W807_CYCAE|nr:unnamed protein product [Cyclocybe aegerita]
MNQADTPTSAIGKLPTAICTNIEDRVCKPISTNDGAVERATRGAFNNSRSMGAAVAAILPVDNAQMTSNDIPDAVGNLNSTNEDAASRATENTFTYANPVGAVVASIPPVDGVQMASTSTEDAVSNPSIHGAAQPTESTHADVGIQTEGFWEPVVVHIRGGSGEPRIVAFEGAQQALITGLKLEIAVDAQKNKVFLFPNVRNVELVDADIRVYSLSLTDGGFPLYT